MHRLVATILVAVVASCSATAPEPALTPAPRTSASTGIATAPERLRPPTPDDAAAAPSDPFDALAVALGELTPDPPPQQTTNGKHYLVSNERRLDLYRPDIDGLGGAYLGVGTDQNYILAGFVRPELLVIVDFDQQVVDLHAVHGALIRAASDADEFLRLWSAAGEADARAIVIAAFDDVARRRAMLELHASARAEVDGRMRALRKRYAELGIRAWLEDPEQYAVVRALHEERRVVALRGDFTEDGVVRDVARVLEAHGQSLRVLYLSNVEQYVAYRKPFKDNMLALPLHDESLVLRTLPGRPAGFQYILQRGRDFQTWLRAPKVWSVYRLRGIGKGEHLVASERHFIERLPPS